MEISPNVTLSGSLHHTPWLIGCIGSSATFPLSVILLAIMIVLLLVFFFIFILRDELWFGSKKTCGLKDVKEKLTETSVEKLDDDNLFANLLLQNGIEKSLSPLHHLGLLDFAKLCTWIDMSSKWDVDFFLFSEFESKEQRIDERKEKVTVNK